MNNAVSCPEPQQPLTFTPMITRAIATISVPLFLMPGVTLFAQDHPRAPQQSQSQQVPQTRTGAPQAAMTEATMSNVSDGLKQFISGYSAKSAYKYECCSHGAVRRASEHATGAWLHHSRTRTVVAVSAR